MSGILNLVGPNVKKVRLDKKPVMTQEQLAIELQFLGWKANRYVVSKIERGVRHVTDKELVMLTKVLNVSVAVLLDEHP